MPLRAQADWLVCKEICIPASARLDPRRCRFGPHQRRSTRAGRTRSRDARSGDAAPLDGWRATGVPGRQTSLCAPSDPCRWPRRACTALAFFPEREGLIANAQPADVLRPARKGYELRVQMSPQPWRADRRSPACWWREPGFGVPRAPSTVDLPVGAAARGDAPRRHGLACSRCCLPSRGGVLLNLMPCVFPVLAIKVLSVAQRAHGDAASCARTALLFALGVLVSFWAIAGLLLALRAQGEALGLGLPAAVARDRRRPGGAVLRAGAQPERRVPGRRARAGARGGMRARGEHADALLSGRARHRGRVALHCAVHGCGARLRAGAARAARRCWCSPPSRSAWRCPTCCCASRPRSSAACRGPAPGWIRSSRCWPFRCMRPWSGWCGCSGQQAGIDAVARLLLGLVLVAAALWAVGTLGARRRRRARDSRESLRAAGDRGPRSRSPGPLRAPRRRHGAGRRPHGSRGRDPAVQAALAKGGRSSSTSPPPGASRAR